MIPSLQTTFRNVDASPAVEARVQEEAEKLGKYFDGITSCRVIVEAPHRHHLHGESFHIRIELRVPGKELVVAHDPSLIHEEQSESHKHLEVEGPHKNVYVAIRAAFKAMRRQLQDYVHCLRHEVKAHRPHSQGSRRAGRRDPCNRRQKLSKRGRAQARRAEVIAEAGLRHHQAFAERQESLTVSVE